jgi:tight adherence protein C
MLLALVGVFAAVALLSGTAGSLVLSRYSPERRRLRGLTAEKPATAVADDRRLTAETESKTLKPLSSLVPKSPKEMSKLRRRLARGGYYQPAAAMVFSLSELGCAIVAAILPLVALGLKRGAIFAALAAFAGYAVPGFLLLRKIEARKRQLTNGLPDALDLLVVCLEAGCAID